MTNLYPLLVLSHGPVDFTCPYVDTPEGADLISSWTLSLKGDYTCHLRSLHQSNGRPAERTPGQPSTVSYERAPGSPKSSNNPSSMFIHAAFSAALKRKGQPRIRSRSGGARLHVSRDLAIIDVRDTDDPLDEMALPLRSIAERLRISPITGSHDRDAWLLPVWHRNGKHGTSAHEKTDLVRHLAAKMDALLEVSRHPSENIIKPLLLS